MDRKKEHSKAEKTAGAVTRLVELERSDFHKLLAVNPNYFGNLADSPFKAVKKIIGNTTYEELTCIGFNPNLNQLEATVPIKLPTGYGGGLCFAGSTEYVRFFIDYGGGWEDAGMVAVNVHDIPNANDCANKPEKPLVYVLTQPIEPKRDSCGNPVLPLVRGILSWNNPPPAGAANANWPPVWGNVLDRHIQIKPRPPLIIDIVSALGIDPKWGVAGLTASAGVAGWIEFALLRRTLNKRIGRTGLAPAYIVKLWLGAITGAALGWAIKLVVPPLHPIVIAGLVLVPYGLCYFAVTALLGISESKAVVGRASRMLKGRF